MTPQQTNLTGQLKQASDGQSKNIVRIGINDYLKVAPQAGTSPKPIVKTPKQVSQVT